MPSLIAADRLGPARQHALRLADGEQPVGPVGRGLQHRPQRQFFSQLGFARRSTGARSASGWWSAIVRGGRRGGPRACWCATARRGARPSLVAWNRFCAKLAAAGLARAPHEGPLDYLARVRRRAPGARGRGRGDHAALRRGALRRGRHARASCASSRAACGSSAPRERRAPPRNDPCPCGSGRRYKECHGKLDARGRAVDRRAHPARAAAAPAGPHRRGRARATARSSRRARQRDRHALPRHDRVAARRPSPRPSALMRASLAANATRPRLPQQPRPAAARHAAARDEAIACFRRALEVDPALVRGVQQPRAWRSRPRAAGTRPMRAYRAALAREPRFAAAHQNLARAAARCSGASREAWDALPLAPRRAGPRAHARPIAAAAPLPASLAGRRFALRAEQGLGDVLFFLRFAPELARRGAQLAFRGDARLHAMLARTGLFALGMRGRRRRRRRARGDLRRRPAVAARRRRPGALPARRCPRAARRARRARWRARSQPLGPAPRIALTWRAGVDRRRARAHAGEGSAARSARPARCAARRRPGSRVQRRPAPGEREALAAALGAPVHDFSARQRRPRGDAGADRRSWTTTSASATPTRTCAPARAVDAGARAPSAGMALGPRGERSPWFPAANRAQCSGRWTEAQASCRIPGFALAVASIAAPAARRPRRGASAGYIAGRIFAGSTGLPCAAHLEVQLHLVGVGRAHLGDLLALAHVLLLLHERGCRCGRRPRARCCCA